jgi:hypothetical protein
MIGETAKVKMAMNPKGTVLSVKLFEKGTIDHTSWSKANEHLSLQLASFPL